MKPWDVLTESRIWLITGNYGSGKTELSLNLALDSAKSEATTLVDLDIVNPYFRSAEHTQTLEQSGIDVLMPTFALTTVDIPALPPQIVTAFERPERRVFIDVGGDDTGSVALGRYKPYIEKSGAKLLFVINTRRPLTRDVESILDLVERVTARARTPVSAFVNNTNTGRSTTVEEIIEGRAITEAVMARLGVERAFHAADNALIDRLPADMRPFTYPITPLTRPEWLDM